MALERLWDPEARPGMGERALLPLLRAGEGLFRAGVALREALYRRGFLEATRAPIPVISVGGIEVGGTGKTPLVLELTRIAAASGLRPAILTRGYGRTADATAAFDPTEPRPAGRNRAVRVPPSTGPGGALLFGDEPLWLAEESSRIEGTYGVWVARRRIHAARAAAGAGAALGILDDGFQHRSLARDGEVVSLTGCRPFGNRRLLPAGPLREPPAALARADRIVLAGVAPDEATEARRAVESHLRPGTPIRSWRSVPALRSVRGKTVRPGEPVCLLSGIAHPERLPRTLAALGHEALRTAVYPDHHRFRSAEVEALLAGAGPGSALVTTAKDWHRLAAVAAEVRRISILEQRLLWNEPEAEGDWENWLRSIVRPADR